MSRQLAVRKPPAADPSQRATWWIAGLSLLFLTAGLLGARWWMQQDENDPPPSYVEFHKLAITSSGGLVVLSIALEADPQHVSRIEGHKSALEAGFREELALLDPRAMYSREGKVALASGLRNLANHVLRAELVNAVYFGDFRIYDRPSRQAY